MKPRFERSSARNRNKAAAAGHERDSVAAQATHRGYRPTQLRKPAGMPSSPGSWVRAFLAIVALLFATSFVFGDDPVIIEEVDVADASPTDDAEITADEKSQQEYKQKIHRLDKVDKEEDLRKYGQGRLRLSDFQSDLPEDREDLDAMLATQIRIYYRYRCRYGRRYGGRAEADLTSLDVFAVIRPEESWIATPNDWRLMDHEQGHFDVAEIAALTARLHLYSLWEKGELVGNARYADDAIEEMKEKIEEAMKPFYVKLRKAQLQYDELTRHGRRLRVQREQRKIHAEILGKLKKTLEESDWYQAKLKKSKPPGSTEKEDDSKPKGETVDNA